MRKIKKYANRKLYDTTEKKYISMDKLSQLIKAGEEVLIIDNKTGEDITASIISQLLAKDNIENENGDTSGILIQMLRKGSGTVVGYAKKYVSLWQGAMTMAEDEIDKLVNLLVKDKEITESEGSKLKKEMKSYADNFKNWVGDKVDQRVNEALSMMNLATREQVQNMTERIEDLSETVDKLEKKIEMKSAAETNAAAAAAKAAAKAQKKETARRQAEEIA